MGDRGAIPELEDNPIPDEKADKRKIYPNTRAICAGITATPAIAIRVKNMPACILLVACGAALIFAGRPGMGPLSMVVRSVMANLQSQCYTQ
jgi:hypothetical protein